MTTNQEYECAISDLTKQNKEMETAKDIAYSERNQLVALLSKVFPASIEKHEGEDWEDDWRNIVFIKLPTGQASWHIHDSELPMFSHLSSVRPTWYRHTTEEKYNRIESLTVDHFAYFGPITT